MEILVIKYFLLKIFYGKGYAAMENLREKEYYKEKIIELVEKIENPMILIKIFVFIKTWMEE